MFRRLWLVGLLFCTFTTPVNASLPWPLEGLLRRADTVFIGHVTAQSANAITFKVIKPMRGSISGSFTFTFSHQFDALDQRSDYLVISQGDHFWGPPKPRITLGQGVIGQASDCGWIMFPIKQSADGLLIDRIYSDVGENSHNSTLLTRGQLENMIAKHPYSPGRYPNPRR